MKRLMLPILELSEKSNLWKVYLKLSKKITRSSSRDLEIGPIGEGKIYLKLLANFELIVSQLQILDLNFESF